jgi:hypothetical protein
VHHFLSHRILASRRTLHVAISSPGLGQLTDRVFVWLALLTALVVVVVVAQRSKVNK